MPPQSKTLTIEDLGEAVRIGGITLPKRHFDVDGVGAKPRVPAEPIATKPKLRVFLCYAPEDKEDVRELKKRLIRNDVDPWLDEDEILPGQEWEHVIEEAMETMDCVIICLSNSSVSKTGYVQKEIRRALNYADLHPPGDNLPGARAAGRLQGPARRGAFALR